MAKNKPNLAFLEALKQEKRRRGDEGTGGGFKTPEWFFNSAGARNPSQPGMPSPLGPHEARRPGFRFTLRYAIIGSAVLLVAVIAAYMAGRGQSRPQLSEPTPVIKAGPAQPGVIDLQEKSNGGSLAPAPMVPATPPPGSTAGGWDRTIGMNYVIIQSYPSEVDAQEIANILRQAGIGCTVERNHPYAPKWYVIIGTREFAKTNTPEYRDYLRKLQQVSEKIPSKFRRFEPSAYRWK